jgi:hypothetical protein
MTLTDQEISKKVRELRKIKGPVYAPLKYFRGLNTLKDVETRYMKMKKKTYTKFQQIRRENSNVLVHETIP